MNDDLTQLFAEPPEPAGQEMRYRQGVIVTFNQTTLENTVNVGGTVFTNLKVLGLAEAATFVPGAVVAIFSVGGSTKTMAIAGRWVTPNTAEAAQALSFLGGFVKGKAEAGGNNIGNSTTYFDGSSAGPAVSDVRIGPSQSALVIVSAQCSVNVWRGTTWMSYEVGGATTLTATDERGLALGTVGSAELVRGRISAAFLHDTSSGGTPLNAGLNTFTAKYRVSAGGGAAGDVLVQMRNLIVIPL